MSKNRKIAISSSNRSFGLRCRNLPNHSVDFVSVMSSYSKSINSKMKYSLLLLAAYYYYFYQYIASPSGVVNVNVVLIKNMEISLVYVVWFLLVFVLMNGLILSANIRIAVQHYLEIRSKSELNKVEVESFVSVGGWVLYAFGRKIDDLKSCIGYFSYGFFYLFIALAVHFYVENIAIGLLAAAVLFIVQFSLIAFLVWDCFTVYRSARKKGNSGAGVDLYMVLAMYLQSSIWMVSVPLVFFFQRI